MGLYDPKPEHKFTFGLWTTSNPGRDPFGEPTRAFLDPVANIAKMAEIGAWGYNFHDNDLIPFGASAAEEARIKKAAKKVMADTGIVASMGTCNMFSNPVFKDGAFTSSDANVRAYALQKSMRAIDLAVEMGCTTYVFWGGREGSEVDGAKDLIGGLKHFRDALNFLSGYVKDNKYNLKFALEAKPNEPRGDIFLPTTGAMLAFIETLEHSAMCGVNPEYAHETMCLLNFTHAVAQAIEMKKLFHIDLNGQKMGRFDQDLRFGSEDLKNSFYLVKLIEDSGYNGPRHFDCHAYRSENEAGVWDFARGNMRSYLILKEKARQFATDREIQALLADIHVHDDSLQALVGKYSKANMKALKAKKFDVKKLAARPLPYERFDQLVMELLTGVR